ncbi:MAG: thioredoxin family protein [Bacteroidetes bacterium]|nr:thioredoxin family protein [Bacteroidota bacterium]
MKSLLVNLFFIVLFINCIGNNEVKAQKIAIQNAFKMAHEKSKPVLVLLYSKQCYSSRVFRRKIYDNGKLNHIYSKNFICIEVEAESSYGRALAKRNKILILPAMLFLSNDSKLKYICKMSMDTNDMKRQIYSFVHSTKLFDLISLYHKTNNVSLKESQRIFAEYYSKRDLKNHSNQLLIDSVKNETLKIKWFRSFQLAYIRNLRGGRA